MAQENQQPQSGQNDGSRAGTQEAQRRETTEGEAARAQGTSIARPTSGGRQALSRPMMTPSTAGPFSMMRRMMEDMDRMFDDFGMGSLLSPLGMGGMLSPFSSPLLGRRMQAWSPQIEVAEREGQLVVKADVPGMTMDDIQVEVEPGVLTISGERSGEQTEQRGNISYSERSYGSFSRSIPIPEGVDTEQIDASFANGVLEVKVKLPEQQMRGRKVQIKSGAGNP
jgi:HSP20 family protein